MLIEDEAPIQNSDNEVNTPEMPEVPTPEPESPPSQAMTPANAQKKEPATISPEKSKEDVLEIARSPTRKSRAKTKKRSLRSNDPNVLTRSARKVTFSPQPILRSKTMLTAAFHQNEIVSLKKMLSSKFSKSPTSGIIKPKNKKN